MSNTKRTLRRLGLCTVSALVALACGGASDADDTGRLMEDDLLDAGQDADDDAADDDVSTGGGGDDDAEGPGDISVDDDASSDDDATSDDDILDDDGFIGGDDDVSLGMDASAPTDSGASTGELPGGGFVTIDMGDGGTFEILCGTETCACADSLDNDGDGLMDGADSECTGPFDHDETTFATGIPGDNRDPKWQDCFFDGNSGAGDDGCRYHTDCLTGDIDAGSPSCSVTDQCRDYCAPLTPPGCDCFGCCQVALDDGDVAYVLASETCSVELIDDEAACQSCEQTDSCGNECGECEICIGETLEDLPETCFENPPDGSGGSGAGGGPGVAGSGSGGEGNGGSNNAGAPNSSGGSGGGDPPDEPPPNVCDGNAQPCLVSDDCGSGQYCTLGCCKTLPAR